MSVLMESAREIAAACGFTHMGALDPVTIDLRMEVRAACAENKCGSYGTNWACPPGCGTLDECRKNINMYSCGLIVQTTGILSDPFDGEGVQRASDTHAEAFGKFCKAIRKISPDALMLNTGPCKQCAKCTYPDAPCRFPEKMVSSMEAYGMIVSDVCKAHGLPYYYGQNTLTYNACVLFK
jgi:predicted metal-binding protein